MQFLGLRAPVGNRVAHLIEYARGSLSVQTIQLRLFHRDPHIRLRVLAVDGERVCLLCHVRIDVERRRQPPARGFPDEAVIAQVVITIADQDVEEHPPKELRKVLIDVALRAVVRVNSARSR